MTTFARKLKSQGCTWALLGATAVALGTATAPPVAAEETGTQNYVQILSTQEVSYTAIVTRGTDAINTKPWGTAGFQTISSSQTYLGTEVTVTQEQVADNGVTWALISMDGQEIGWIAKTALTPGSYAKAVSTNTVDYPATIARNTDAINTQPWGAKGYQTVASSSAYYGKSVTVSQEKTMDYGVTWALISIDGKELGWIAKDALKAQTYAAIVSEKTVEYSATINRATDAINKAPWGTKGFQTIASSAAYVGKTVEVTKEQTTDYGVIWAQISLNGEVLGWIAKDALKVQTYAQITKETAVSYDAIVNRDSDAINTAPWGVKGYQTLSSSAAYVRQTVQVTKEQVTDYGVTWAQISLNGEALGWIAKDALTAQTYAQVTKETAVAYSAAINRESDAINTAPWGTKGYQTLATSAAYVGQTVDITKEQETDYGVTWAQISLNDEVLGWIAKDALKIQSYAQITEETAVDYSATISRATDAINTAPWGTKGYQTLASSADYRDQTVEVTKEQVTDYGVTWAQISLNGEVLGWIAKDALKVQGYAQIMNETAVEYYAIIRRGTDVINTAPWGVRGYQTVGSSAGYIGKTVEVTKEQTTDYGVTWAQISLDGEVLGWIAKAGVYRLYEPSTSETTAIEVVKENMVAPVTIFERSYEYLFGYSELIGYGSYGYDSVIYERVYNQNGTLLGSVEVSRETIPVKNITVTVGNGTFGRSEDGLFHIVNVREFLYINRDELDYIIADGNYIVDDTYQMDSNEVSSYIYRPFLNSNFNSLVYDEVANPDFKVLQINPATNKSNTITFAVDALEALSAQRITELTFAKIKENNDLYALYTNSNQNSVAYTYNAGVASVIVTAH